MTANKLKRLLAGESPLEYVPFMVMELSGDTFIERPPTKEELREDLAEWGLR